jgi:hypothetical protein
LRHGCLLSSLLLNIEFEFLARATRQENEIKEIQIGKEENEIKEIQIRKEEIKLLLFVEDMSLYLKDPKDSTKKTLRCHKHFQQSSWV